MWKLTIEDDEGKPTVLPLAHEEYGLGRGESNAIRLTDRNISRTHAILKKNGVGWFLKDLQSYNGTFVNGARVVGEQGIQSGDLVQIGDYRLELLDDAVSGPIAVDGTPAVTAPVHQRPNRLVVVVGPVPGAEFPLDKDHFTIGRSEEATISVNHSSVSRVHAELIALGNGRYEIVDKASANGIRINGVELKRGILEAGDALELGDVRMRFVGAGKIFRADHSQQLGALPAFDGAAPPVTGSPGSVKPGLGMGKLVALGVGVGVAVIAAIVMLTRPEDPAAAASSGGTHASGQVTGEGTEQLKQAQAKLAAKDIEGAHQKVQEIPENSTVRDDPAVKDIEGAWADMMFGKVDSAPDSATKKTILRTVSSTPTVDPERRKKAADMLREIEAKEPPPPPPVYNGGDPGVARPLGTGATTATPTSTGKVEPVPGGPSIPTGLAAEDAQRKALEPKVFGGRASVDEIRMLKALCGHLGNHECRDRAAAILKKKLADSP